MTAEQENNFNVFCDFILELIEQYEDKDTEDKGTD